MSIVVPAHNRPEYVVQAIESILASEGCGPDVEICVSDNSGDSKTRESLLAHPTLSQRVRYRDSSDAAAVDQNFVAAVAMASNEYVWILGDDDIAEKDALARVMAVIAERSPGIIIMNSRSFCGDQILEDRRVSQTVDVHYGVDDNDRFLIELAGYVTFVSAIVIKKNLWDAVDKAPWIGSSFVHVATLLEAKLHSDAYFMSQPTVRMRVGSQTWSSQYFQIWQVSYPSVIWRARYSDTAKATVVKRQPLKSIARMAAMRAYGYLNFQAVRDHVLRNSDLNFFNRLSNILLCCVPVALIRWSYLTAIKVGLRKRSRNFSPELAMRWLRRQPDGTRSSFGG